MRLRDISISVLGHAALAATVLAWPLSAPPAPPVIYEVALADMAPASAGASAPPAPQAALPAPPKPTPHKTVPPPAERVISAHKAQDAAAPAPAPAPATEQPPASPASSSSGSPAAQGQGGGRSGPQMSNFGGVSAYDANSVDERPSVLRGAMPEYPQQARRMRQEGRVLVRVVVDEQGSPVTALVQEASPSGVFDQAALSAARRFRFLPGKLAGRRVMTAVLIPFEFTLR